MKIRIKDTPVSSSNFCNELSKRYEAPFAFYFDERKEEVVYISDKDFEKNVNSLLTDSTSKIVYLLGMPGSGRTTYIHSEFKMQDNNVRIDKENDSMYLTISFQGQTLESNVESYIIRSVSMLCTEIREQYYFTDNSEEEFLKLYYYIRKTKGSLLEYIDPIDLIGVSAFEEKKIRLKKGYEKDPYTYIASNLKYYIDVHACPIKKINIFVDNIEALPFPSQVTIVRDMLACYSCFRNLLHKNNDDSFQTNLVISIRTRTYTRLMEFDKIRVYGPKVVLQKDFAVVMSEYFEKKRKIAKVPENEKNVWNEAFDLILNMDCKFEGRYSDMISNLSNYDFQMRKKTYKKILTNKVWILRGERRRDFIMLSKTDSLFNNISVLRSLACGNNAVYRGEKSILVPNIFVNDEVHDDTIIALLALSFIINKEGEVKYIDIIKKFRFIFKNDSDISSALKRVLFYFIDTEVILLTYPEHIRNSENKNLIITPRGRELYVMLTRDSVLLEMYREDHYFEANSEYCNFKASYNIAPKDQADIFLELISFIKYLCKMEKQLHKKAYENGTLEIYYSNFGKNLQVTRILEGVEKSIHYSGKIASCYIQNSLYEIKEEIKKIDIF